MAKRSPARASVKSATLVTVIARSVGATTPSNANKVASTAAARRLLRRQNQSVLPRKRAAKTAAAAGKLIQKMSTASQVAKVRPARMSPVRVFSILLLLSQ
jgi:hypothetical protein